MFYKGQRVFVHETDDTPESWGTVEARRDVDGEPGYIVHIDATNERDLVCASLIELRQENPTGHLHSSVSYPSHAGHMVQYSLKKPNNGEILSDATGRNIEWSFEARAYLDQDTDASVGSNFDDAVARLGISQKAIKTIRADWSEPSRIPWHQRSKTKSTKVSDAVVQDLDGLLSVVSDTSKTFLEKLQARKELTTQEAIDALGLSGKKAIGGVVGGITRKAQKHGLYPPFTTKRTADGHVWS